MIRLFKFWKRHAEVDPEAIKDAHRKSRESRDSAHALFAEAQMLFTEAKETADTNRKLRESNGFVEAIQEMWFAPEDRDRPC